VAVRPPATDTLADDPAEGEDASRPVASTRAVEIGLYLLLLALAGVLGYDNWRSGMGWARDGPQSGYLPFYLCMILTGASLWGLGTVLLRSWPDQVFVTRDRLRRVLQVFVPTLLFCIAMQWLGLYVASFLLIAGFMRLVGRIAWWKAILTAAVFAVVMFVTFEIAFDVLMPKGPLEALFGR
jgi:putative tricarboxylic transport membrane protein